MIGEIFTILDQGDHMTDGFGMMDGFGGGWWMWIMIVGGMFMIPILAIWTYQDAQQYGENPALWALVVFFTMGFGFILYMIVRNPNNSSVTAIPQPSPPQPPQNIPSKTVTYSSPTQYNRKTNWENKGAFCENCGSSVTVTDNYCPKCGTPVGGIKS
ncbi:MAG: zinc ribbon domain-containing protein [Candidatus Hodarchaeales archaeon]|jgi:hypothetical protein